MEIERLEDEAKFVAANAEHNLNMMLQNPEIVSESHRQKSIAQAAFMMNLHLSFQEQNKNARRAGRTLGLRTRLKSLVLLILSPSARESKGEGA
ncbi:hypothetical protein MMB75_07035 [Paenibacillus sp. P2(2022)]|uniref:hypothetical protein n=1 Tax=Paenibacillus TaxID=44249 RepID=UPI001C9DB9C9|nr:MULTISPECIES: hypothetical protein [Paenibacillus]MBY7736756.1 hypothetical protein [Paenibacillus polymyxa]MDG0053422.1 hypothetical protein [Paenibacillus sp. P2(2022)]